MGQVVRIRAEHVGDPDDPQDARWKIVFVGVLDGGKLRRQEFFGYCNDVDDNNHEVKWPFRMLPPKGNVLGKIDFGAGAEAGEQYESINVYEKNVQVGELFTRSESTYRVTSISPFGQEERS